MSTLTMTKGLPASGKSTWAKEIVKKNPKTKRINKDDLRAMMDAGEWSREREKAVVAARNAMVDIFLSTGFDVIVDDTNFAQEHEHKLRELAASHNAQFKIKDFSDTPVEVCIERDRLRSNSVGEKVILDMYNKYIYKPVPYVPYNPKLPDCLLVDLDGTLFNMGDRSPFDWGKVHMDTPRHVVWDAVQGVWASRKNKNTKIIFVSGRDACCRELSAASLFRDFGADVNAEHHEFYMRPEGDARKDTVVKEEIYRNHIEGKYNVVAIFDDRPQVVRMWLSLGMGDRLFNVGNGREF